MEIRKHIPAYPLSNFIQHIVYVKGSLPVSYIKEPASDSIDFAATILNAAAAQHSKYNLTSTWVSHLGLKILSICYIFSEKVLNSIF